MITITPLKITGCFEIAPYIHKDARGKFVKNYIKDDFVKFELATDFAEEFHSVSLKGALRGLHFQLPPYDHAKMVYCIAGTIVDAVLDLRIGSPTFRQFHMQELNDESCKALYMPNGCAHGFYVKSDAATIIYKVTTVHSPEHDTGILWNSAGIPWPDKTPIISERDKSFIQLSQFKSPFKYTP
jgi:dTDP-4-dehydrorhamnose 3,5-epimerase